MRVPPQSFFAALEPAPPEDVVSVWWGTVEALSLRDGFVVVALERASEQEQPGFVLELYYFLLDVARLCGDLQLVWTRMRGTDAPVMPEDWAPVATDPTLHIADSDQRSHVRVYREVAVAAHEAFQRHSLPQLYKVVHSPMLMGSTDTVDVSPVDALGEIAAALAVVAWYRDYLLAHPLPTADTIRWIVREVQMATRSRAMRHVLSMAYALYDVVIGNDLDRGES